MAGLKLTREGDDLRLDDPDTSLRVRFGNVKESSDGLHAIIRVQYVNGRGPADILTPVRLNLLGPNARRDLVRSLKDRNPHMSHVDWADLVEQACANAIYAVEQGEPFLDLFDQPEPEWSERELVKGFLPQGETTVLFADGGSGKSTVAGALSASILTGVAFVPGLEPVEVKPVAYLDWESNWKEHRRRLDSLFATQGLGRPQGFTYRNNYRALADELSTFRREIAQKGIGFVVVDSAVPASGDDIKDTSAPRQLFNGLRSLGDDVTRLVLAHMSKAEAEREQGRARVMGSVMYENLARSVWEMRRSENAREDEIVVGLYHRKMNGGRLQKPFGLRITFDHETQQPLVIDRCDVRDYPDLADRLPVKDRLRDLLGKGAMDTKEIAQELGLTLAAAKKMLSRRSDVEQISQGKGPGRHSVWGVAVDHSSWP